MRKVRKEFRELGPRPEVVSIMNLTMWRLGSLWNGLAGRTRSFELEKPETAVSEAQWSIPVLV